MRSLLRRRSFLFATLVATATTFSTPAAIATPRLVVLIVVDQMRNDYLDRFDPIFTGGFRQLLDDGLRFEQTRQLHAVTATAPGHTTISTGCNPSKHGIVGNTLFIDGTFKRASLDLTTTNVGANGAGSSSRDSRVDMLGDWMKRSDAASKVIAISIKDRAATMLGGKKPDACLYFDSGSGHFVTSTWYSETLPPFVASFESAHPIDELIGREWRPRLDDATFNAVGATADAMPYEGRTTGVTDAADAVFPHQVTVAGDIRFTPFGDDRILALAEAAIASEQLGTDDHPDLLAISLSAADYIGHAYGPDSREIADYYAWLDQRLVSFLDAARRGDDPTATLFVITADHGVNPIVERSQSAGTDAGRVPLQQFTKQVDEKLDRWFGPADWVSRITPDIYINPDALATHQVERDTVADVIADYVVGLPGIEDAFTHQQMVTRNPAVPASLVRSYDPERSGDVLVLFKDHYHLDYLDDPEAAYVKANHATHHIYDQRIPLIFAGGGVSRGETRTKAASIDVAPTIASLLGVAIPSHVDGLPLDVGGSFPPPTRRRKP